MCTVTYLPGKDQQYILTQNRDEKMSRGIAHPPKKQKIGNHTLLCPTDDDAKGTWIASSEKYSSCLLNGGFTKHIPKSSYPNSRGKIIHDLFRYDDVESFLDNYSFAAYQPFTLIVRTHDTNELWEIVLQETELNINKKNPMLPHIWSSSTLYSLEEQLMRKYYFNLFVQSKEHTRENAIHFHRDGYTDSEDAVFILNKEDNWQTVSITSIAYNKTPNMKYLDLINRTETYLEI